MIKDWNRNGKRVSTADLGAVVAADDDADIPLDPARAGEMVPIYPVTVEVVVVVVAFALYAAAVVAEDDVVAAAVGAAAGVKERVDAVVAEERRKDRVADYSVLDLTKRLANEEDIGS
jgi:hypothetical protein